MHFRTPRPLVVQVASPVHSGESRIWMRNHDSKPVQKWQLCAGSSGSFWVPMQRRAVHLFACALSHAAFMLCIYEDPLVLTAGVNVLICVQSVHLRPVSRVCTQKSSSSSRRHSKVAATEFPAISRCSR